MSDIVKIAVIVGEHPYDVPGFQNVFSQMRDIECYFQNLQEFTGSEEKTRNWYDVLLFYNYHLITPSDGNPWFAGDVKTVMESLGYTGQGIFILHHAVLAYPDWGKWSDICGIQNRRFKFHDIQAVNYEIVKHHPITEGVDDFSMIDETYEMEPTGDSSDVLVTTDHPLSAKTILWTRTYKKSDVVCYLSGHDDSAYSDYNFRRLTENAVKWLSGKPRA